MGYIMNGTNDHKIMVKAADYPNAADCFHTLMEDLDGLIERCDEPEELKIKAKKDIYTDIIIPGLKRLYQECVDYVLWGTTRSISRRPRNYYSGVAVERDYTDNEEEDSEE